MVIKKINEIKSKNRLKRLKKCFVAMFYEAFFSYSFSDIISVVEKFKVQHKSHHGTSGLPIIILIILFFITF